MTWLDEHSDVLRREVLSCATVFRCELTDNTTIRLWSGNGSLTLGADAIEPSPNAVYYGLGDIRQLPSFSSLRNGIAERLDFSFSGVDPTSDFSRLADEESQTIRGAKVNLGLTFFDVTGQVATPTRWEWEGRADVLVPESRSTEDGRLKTVTLSVGSVFTARSTALSSFYTSQSQQARSPGDTFCDRTSRYSQGVEKPWPRL